MDQPPGFVDQDNPSFVCRLTKAIYGLKQTPRAWYTELRNYFLTVGFCNFLEDSSLFILRPGLVSVYLLVYVDDILITGNDEPTIQRILHQLANHFSIKGPEELNYFLGIKEVRTSAGLHLSQRKYIMDLLHKHGMTDAKPVGKPMASSPKLTLCSGTSLSDPTTYRWEVYNTFP